MLYDMNYKRKQQVNMYFASRYKQFRQQYHSYGTEYFSFPVSIKRGLPGRVLFCISSCQCSFNLSNQDTNRLNALGSGVAAQLTLTESIVKQFLGNKIKSR